MSGLKGAVDASLVRRQLRELIESPSILMLPGAVDALTARIIETVGFRGAYVTGAGFANAAFGLPDVGLISFPELREHVSRLTTAVDIPLVVDADTGFGGVLNVQRTVRELEAAGAAAIQIEDQRDPKRCGHFDGQQLVSVDEMVQRVAAATDARRDKDLLIVARTDAYGSEGLMGAVSRARAYVAAGADVIFVEAPSTADDLAVLPHLIQVPLLANMVEGGKTPLQTTSELERLGFAAVLFANTALRVSMRAVRDAMSELLATGDASALGDRVLPWADRQRLVGLADAQELEERFLAQRA